ncbi:MAG: hypothetical protein JOZ07_06970 [Solirubrobacterales bacterium]|nr:hypothetical protein [Solirubrobacterales bacterium]
MELNPALNLRELQRYLGRVDDRWPLAVVMVGGSRVDEFRGFTPDGVRDTPFVVVLVSHAFESLPTHERTYQAASLWDALEMGDPAEVYCFTTPEFLRRRLSTPAVRAVIERGLLMFQDSAPVPFAMPRERGGGEAHPG